jgi:hypothetical protein
MLLGTDWINANHIHLYGDQQRLTIPDENDGLISISYVQPSNVKYSAYLLKQITLPPHSQTSIDVTANLRKGKDLIFQPAEKFRLKFIFIPNAVLNVRRNTTKVFIINAQNRQQTLSKNTRIGTISYEKMLLRAIQK